MKALVGAFNQEKALVGAFSVIVQPVVEPMDRFAALVTDDVCWSRDFVTINTRPHSPRLSPPFIFIFIHTTGLVFVDAGPAALHTADGHRDLPQH